MATKEKTVLTEFKDYKPVRVSQELYELNRVRFKLSVHGSRLLYALAQSIDYNQQDLFPEYGFDIQAVFKYLGVENNGRRYEVLNEALKDIGENILNIRHIKKSGAIRWIGMPWITKYSFASDEKLLNIQINENVKPFLLNLKQYALIRPKDYLKLSTEYQNWFYPYLKNVVKLGKWRVSIDDLKQALFLEKSPSYDPTQNKNATENFLKFVVGIKISEKAKQENVSAKHQKKAPRLYDWDYTSDKNGNYTGTLYGITENTDIKVTASVEKTGRSYTHIVFFVSSKSKKDTIPAPTNMMVEEDMGKPQQRNKRKREFMQIGELFDFKQEMQTEVPKARFVFYTDAQVNQMAKEFKMPKTEFLRVMRLEKHTDGRYIKEY